MFVKTSNNLVIYLTLVLLAICGAANFATADEPCKRFLEKLKASGMREVAVEYLEEMKGSDLASDDFKLEIPFELAQIYLDQASTARGNAAAQQHLDRAQTVLDQFVVSNPPEHLASKAERLRAGLLIARSRQMLDRIKSNQLADNEEAKIRSEAQELLKKASDSFEANRKSIVEASKQFQLDPNDPESKKQFEKLKNEYVHVRLMAPSVLELTADALPKNDPQRQQKLRQAIKQYSDIGEEYWRRIGGLDALIGAGRCYAKLKQYDEALSRFTDILGQGDDPVLRSRKVTAANLAYDCWLAKGEFPAYEVIAWLSPLAASMTKLEEKSPAWGRIQLALARAHRANFERIEEKRPENAEERQEMNESEKSSVKYARAVDRSGSPLRGEAKKLLSGWNVTVNLNTANNTQQPATLNDAIESARQAIGSARDAQREMQSFQAKADAGDAAAKKSLESSGQNFEALTKQALADLELALQLTDEQTKREDLAEIRLRQCQAHLLRSNLVEASIFGQYVLRRFPSSPAAAEAADLTLKALWQSYVGASEDEQETELEQLVELCESILASPATNNSSTAAQILAVVSIQRGDTAAAEKYLSTIPADSPQRASVERNIGRALWSNYLSLKAKNNGQIAEDDAVAAQLLDGARRYLSSGVAALDPDRLTPINVRHVLFLVEVMMEIDEVEEAVELLENSPVALLDLIKQKHPAVSDSALQLDIYRQTIRAYLGAVKTGGDSAKWISKARGIVDVLQQELMGSEEGERQLLGIYYRLVRELNSEFDGLDSEATRRDYAVGIESLLENMEGMVKDAKLQAWIANSFSDLGDTLRQYGLHKESQRFFATAIDSYDKLMKRSPAELAELDERQQSRLKRRRALAQRGTGDFQSATESLSQLLAPKPGVLDLQIDAAETYEMQGITTGDPQFFELAIRGSHPQKSANSRSRKNVIWGWHKLAQVTIGNKKHQTSFLNAVYHLNFCRYQYGKIKKQNRLLEIALNEISAIQKRIPGMGGDKMKSIFTQLCREMQGQLGKPQTGIPAEKSSD